MISKTRGILLSAIALSFVLSFFAPIVGMILLLSAVLAVLARKRRTIFLPEVAVTLFALSYFLLGGINVSSYRGQIDSRTMGMALQMVCLLACGSMAGLPMSALGREPSVPLQSVSKSLFALALVPGLVGLALIARTGFPLFAPARFVLVSGKAFFLSELLFVPFFIATSNYLASSGGVARRWLVAAVVLLFLLALPGYRGWPIMAIMIFVMVRWGSGRGSSRALLVSGVMVGLIMSGLVVVRRAFDWGLSPTSQLLADNGALWLGEFFGLLHISLRESIAISQWMIFGSASDIGGQSLFLSDFLTVLPGARPSGGVLVAEALGVTRGVGLTPGALGSLVYEFGYVGFLCMSVALGFVTGKVAGHGLADRTWLSRSYALLGSFYLVHYLHRGIPKPAYILVLLGLILVCTADRHLRAERGKRSG